MSWTAWLTTLAAALLILAALQMILREDGFKKYAMLSCRILLLCLLLQPLPAILGQGSVLSSWLEGQPNRLMAVEQTTMLEKKVAGDIQIWLQLEDGFENCRVSVQAQRDAGGQLKINQVVVDKQNPSGPGTNAQNMRAMGLICGRYQLSSSQVIFE